MKRTHIGYDCIRKTYVGYECVWCGYQWVTPVLEEFKECSKCHKKFGGKTKMKKKLKKEKTEYQKLLERKIKTFKELHPLLSKLEKKYGQVELFSVMRKYIDIIQTKQRAEKKIKEKQKELDKLKKELR